MPPPQGVTPCRPSRLRDQVMPFSDYSGSWSPRDVLGGAGQGLGPPLSCADDITEMTADHWIVGRLWADCGRGVDTLQGVGHVLGAAF